MSSHPIVHVDFSAKDQGVAGKFYAELFSWQIQHVPEMDYSMFTAGAGPGGGFSPVGEDNPPGQVIVFIGTDDIDATLAKAVSLGGKVLKPKDEIPNNGWLAIFEDPTGNKVGLYTSM